MFSTTLTPWIVLNLDVSDVEAVQRRTEQNGGLLVELGEQAINITSDAGARPR